MPTIVNQPQHKCVCEREISSSSALAKLLFPPSLPAEGVSRAAGDRNDDVLSFLLRCQV